MQIHDDHKADLAENPNRYVSPERGQSFHTVERVLGSSIVKKGEESPPTPLKKGVPRPLPLIFVRTLTYTSPLNFWIGRPMLMKNLRLFLILIKYLSVWYVWRKLRCVVYGVGVG